MFDIKELERQARDEVNEERAKDAKTKIKAKLKAIAAAEAVAANLRQEYAVLLRDIGA